MVQVTRGDNGGRSGRALGGAVVGNWVRSFFCSVIYQRGESGSVEDGVRGSSGLSDGEKH